MTYRPLSAASLDWLRTGASGGAARPAPLEVSASRARRPIASSPITILEAGRPRPANGFMECISELLSDLGVCGDERPAGLPDTSPAGGGKRGFILRPIRTEELISIVGRDGVLDPPEPQYLVD